MRPFRYLTLDPFESLQNLQSDFGDFLWDTIREVSAGHPPVNVYYNEECAIIDAELPGVKKEDIGIEVLGNTVTLKAERKQPEGENILRQERYYGSFNRSIQMPFELNPDAVEATLQDGVLSIKLPRKEDEKPRKVTINSLK